MRAKKQLGQHWLVAPGIIKKICETPPSQANILEIGPGTGRLSEILAQNCKSLLLLEKDPELATHLKDKFSTHTHVRIIEADALEFDFSNHLHSYPWIVSNLPYNVGTSILTRLLSLFPAGTELVLMFQKEVACRINASIQTKAYGSLSVFCQTLCDIKKICDVPPGAFLPPPEVDSQVLHFKIKDPKLELEKLRALERLCQAAFNQRRKMLRQSLKSVVTASNIPWLLDGICQGTDRPEALSPTQWLQITLKSLDKIMPSG